MLDQFEADVRDWLSNSSHRNRWFEYDQFKIYMRKSRRFFNKPASRYMADYEQTLDLATIEVHPDYRGKGVFKSILARVEDILDSYPEYQLLYIENVGDKRFQRFFEGRGFLKRSGFGDEDCFYKRLL